MKNKKVIILLACAAIIAVSTICSYCIVSINPPATTKQTVETQVRSYLAETELPLSEIQMEKIATGTSEIVTKDLVSEVRSGNSDSEFVVSIEETVRNVMAEQKLTDLSDEEKETLAKAVSAIVESNLADTIKSDSSSNKASLVNAAEKNVDDIKESETANAKAISELSSKITENANAISDLKKGSHNSDEALNKDLKSLTRQLDTLTTNYNELITRYNNASDSILALEDVSNTFASVSSVTEVSQAVSDLSASLSTQIASLQSSINQIEETAGTQTEIQELRNTLAEIQEKVDQTSAEVSTMASQSSVDALSETLNTFMTNQTTTGIALNERAAALEARVNTLETGDTANQLASMLEDYNALMESYKTVAGNYMTLSEIASTMATQEDFNELKTNAAELKAQMEANKTTLDAAIAATEEKINTENGARENADAELQAQIDAVSISVSNTQSEADVIFNQIWGIEYNKETNTEDIKNELSGLNEQIKKTKSLLGNDIISDDATSLHQVLTNAITAYQTADDAIITALSAEETARKEAIELLTTKLAEETNARIEADTKLQGNIDSLSSALKESDAWWSRTYELTANDSYEWELLDADFNISFKADSDITITYDTASIPDGIKVEYTQDNGKLTIKIPEAYQGYYSKNLVITNIHCENAR